MKAQAIDQLRDGISANPSSFVLNFAYAEALELEGAEHFETVHKVYKALLSILREDLDALGTASDRPEEVSALQMDERRN